MKLKTLFLFIFGMGAWLALTNYQIVYSKFLALTDNTPTSTEKVIEEVNIAINTTEEVGEEVNTEAIENTRTETVTEKENLVEDNTDTELLNEADTPITNIAATSNDVEQTVTEKAKTKKEVETPQTTSNQTAVNPFVPPLHNMWMAPMQHSSYNAWLNPMYSMMNPMMTMMGTMMNPAMYMNPMTMMNYPVTTMTHPQNMNAMMMAMDPKLMFGMFGQSNPNYKEGEVPDQLPITTIPGFPTQNYLPWPVNKVSPGVSREAKKSAFQTAMAVSPLSMRDMISIMADKIPVAEDVSWDDAVEAMKLRANEVNFKFVGSSPLWKQIEAETEEPSTKVEIFRFCDARVARKILDEVPEFIVFLPCRIALMEDGEGKLWVMTLDWDVNWLDYAQNPNSHLTKDLRENATRIRESIAYIMEGAATGDF